MVRDLLAEGCTALNRWRNAAMTRTVTYQRGDDSVAVQATPGDVSTDGETPAPTWESRSFKINAADLILGGVPVEPQVGDLITETVADGSVHVTYSVQPPDGRPVFERCENWLAFRVHAMRVYETADQVTYYPEGHLYDPRTLPAHLERSPEAEVVFADTRALRVVLRVPRGAADGRLLEVKPGLDLVDVDLMRNGRMTRFRVDRIVSADHPAFWKIGAVGGELVPL